MNLAKLSAKIYSPLIFAHVRAASAPPVSEINCHPFVNGRYMFMHNGHIDHFRSIKRRYASQRRRQSAKRPLTPARSSATAWKRR